jgi:Arc/MetJ-type ribon-helix-helix transcriptional regulator
MSIIVRLEPELEARLRARVDSGEFASIDAAVEEAVREFILLEPPLEELRAKIAVAVAQLDRGEGVPLDVERIKREGRRWLQDKNKK